jgi:hypothetical protein
MHDSKRMLKASVHRARIDVICPGKLSDSAKPLKCWLGDYIPLPVVQTDEPVYWAADFVGTMRIQIVGASSIVGEQKEKVKSTRYEKLPYHSKAHYSAQIETLPVDTLVTADTA